jgi:hypothetical protein
MNTSSLRFSSFIFSRIHRGIDLLPVHVGRLSLPCGMPLQAVRGRRSARALQTSTCSAIARASTHQPTNVRKGLIAPFRPYGRHFRPPPINRPQQTCLTGQVRAIIGYDEAVGLSRE